MRHTRANGTVDSPRPVSAVGAVPFPSGTFRVRLVSNLRDGCSRAFTREDDVVWSQLHDMVRTKGMMISRLWRYYKQIYENRLIER